MFTKFCREVSLKEIDSDLIFKVDTNYTQFCCGDNASIRKNIEESLCHSKMKGILYALCASPFDIAFEYFTYPPYLYNPKKKLPVELVLLHK